MINIQPTYITAKHLREATPYIRAYSHKKLLILLNLPNTSDKLIQNIAQDLALLHSLNVQATVIINPPNPLGYLADNHTIDQDLLREMQALCDHSCSQLIAKLSIGLINSGVSPAGIPAVSGNFVVAKPRGVIDGQDHQYFGRIRKIKHKPLTDLLESQFMVMLTPFGFSPSGHIFYISPYELAIELASAIDAEKVVVLDEGPLRDENQNIVREWRPSMDPPPEHTSVNQRHFLEFARQSLSRGVQRVHLLAAEEPGALIQEIYTRDGCGTMATIELYEQIRAAKVEDASGILKLVEPLEKCGVLVKRPLTQIESQISHYSVIERDHAIIGCCCLLPLDIDTAELGCFVIAPEYRARNQGDILLDHAVKSARHQGFSKILALTTQTTDWFIERGFEAATVNDLPTNKRAEYNTERNSKIFVLRL